MDNLSTLLAKDGHELVKWDKSRHKKDVQKEVNDNTVHRLLLVGSLFFAVFHILASYNREKGNL